MPVRKMRVEVYDESGNRYAVSLEGKVARKDAMRILDIVELLGGMPGVDSLPQGGGELSKMDKVRFVVEKHFPLVWFSARDLQVAYGRETSETPALSTVSTYLSRLSDRGLLMKSRDSNRVSYRLVSEDVKRLVENI